MNFNHIMYTEEYVMGSHNKKLHAGSGNETRQNCKGM